MNGERAAGSNSITQQSVGGDQPGWDDPDVPDRPVPDRPGWMIVSLSISRRSPRDAPQTTSRVQVTLISESP